MNWQVTRPRTRLRFEAGEPVAMIVPVRRGELAAVAPRLRRLDDDAEVAAAYRAWREERDAFLRDLRTGEATAVEAGWQRDYFLGRDPRGQEAPAHETKMALRPFVEEADPPDVPSARPAERSRPDGDAVETTHPGAGLPRSTVA
jgi:hypothetical protein